jgi:hypothetical protein
MNKKFPLFVMSTVLFLPNVMFFFSVKSIRFEYAVRILIRRNLYAERSRRLYKPQRLISYTRG